MPGSDDDRLLASNPTHYLRQKIDRFSEEPVAWLRERGNLAEFVGEVVDRGHVFPGERLEEFVDGRIISERQAEEYDRGRPQPDCPGLVYEADGDTGWVVPLRAESDATRWSVPGGLPFDAGHLQSLLAQLVDVLVEGDALGGEVGLPERFAFQIRGGIGRGIDGRSMDVAGVVTALLGTFDGPPTDQPPERFRAVASVVQPDAGASTLSPVRSMDAKLEAFVREYGPGSLLIRHSEPGSDTPAADPARWDEQFDQVWVVDTLAELGERLLQAGLLDKVIGAVALSEPKLRGLNNRLARLVEVEHAYQEAERLYQRIARCQLGPGVSFDEEDRTHRLGADTLRHLGRLDAPETHRANRERVAQQTSLRRESSILLGARHAASYYDAHRFGEMVGLLEDLRDEVDEDAKYFGVQTRIEVYNTLARTYVATGRNGWEPLYRTSMELQQGVDDANVSRTRNYLIHGLLRKSDAAGLQRAGSEIAEGLDDPAASAYSMVFLDFYRAELARRRGETRRVERAEQQDYEDYHGKYPPHPLAFYHQAVARQPGRSTDDARDRLSAAHDLLSPREHAGQLADWLGRVFDLARVGLREDSEGWSEAVEALHDFVDERSDTGMKTYYAESLSQLPASPDWQAADAFLECVPYL